MMALSRPEVEVLAITCVSGNVEVDQVVINTLRTLQACDRLDVSKLCYKLVKQPHYHKSEL